MTEVRRELLGRDWRIRERERRVTGLRPRDAATLIVLDRDGPEPKVLMGRRHPAQKFMPGQFVFPGGRADPGDRFAPALGALHPRIEAALASRVVRPSPGRGRALALAAIRETFEETGLLLGETAARPDLPARAGSWSSFVEHGVVPQLSGLRFIARAITPPGRPRRFDTRFFAIDRTAIAGQIEGVIGPDAELTELLWVSLAEARRLDLPIITAAILDELSERLGAGFGHDLPVPFYHAQHSRFVRELI